MARRYLLSIDGGGIRGIIPASALVELERITGRPARETFSFVAGTSTGALIAAALAAEVSALRILEIYITRSAEIFSPGQPWNCLKRLVTGSMYSTQTLYDVIASELREAREWTLNNSPIDLLITAKRVRDGMPWYFVKDRPGNSGCTGRLGLVDCVTASAAAPTYFQPWTVRDPANSPSKCEAVGTLVDGGVGVTGNPVYQACVEAFYYTGGEYVPEETTVVSLGTGRYVRPQSPGNLIQWFKWTLEELLRSPGEQQTDIVRRHFPGILFYRCDPDLPEDVALDDVGSIDRLREYGEQFARSVDWEGILAGADTKCQIHKKNTLWHQYEQAIVLPAKPA